MHPLLVHSTAMNVNIEPRLALNIGTQWSGTKAKRSPLKYEK
jgi:hypothetical protein